MLRGVFTLGALLVASLVALAVASAVLLPVLQLATAVLVAVIKLGFFLAVIYFIVKLISPDTADRALEKIRSKIRRAA
jgi:small-conductance mechanosensitive channel